MFQKSSLAILCLLLVLFFVGVVPGHVRQAVRIMPLGDSITWDITFGDTRPDGLRTGYRQPLWLSLQSEGFDVDFVGSLRAGQDAIPPFDPDNEGHPGWTDSQIASNIYNWLVATPADVILLHIGTNGLDSSPNDVASILNEVDRYEVDHSLVVTVFIARIIQRVPYGSVTTQFNDNVEAMALDRVQNQGDRIVMVDMEDGAGLLYEIDTAALVGDMYDYLHPNSKGYQKMAAQWFAHLRTFLQGGSCPNGITHYWRLDEQNGPPYWDSYAIVNAGCSNCPSPATGTVGGSLLFGTSNQVTLPADASFDWPPGGSFAIELWCNPAVGGGAAGLIGRKGVAAFTTWSVEIISGNKAKFHLQDNGTAFDLVSSGSLSPGIWNHISASRDGSNGLTRLYVNGTQQASATGILAQGFASSAPVTIGYLQLAEESNFQGKIDEIAIYDTTLGASEIAAHHAAGLGGVGYCDGTPASAAITTTPLEQGYVDSPYVYDVNASGRPAPRFRLASSPPGMTVDSVSGMIGWTPNMPGVFAVTVIAQNYFGADTQAFAINVTQSPTCPPNLIHYWTLNESSGAIYSDQVGSNDASCTTCPTSIQGKINLAKEFDRIDDAVSISNDQTFNWGASDSYSIEFWMKQSLGCAGLSQPNNEVIVGRAGAGWWIGIMCESGGNVGRLRCYFQGTDIYSTESVTDGIWHHVVFVRDNSASEWRLYLDGQLDRSASGAGHNLAASDALVLGWFNGPDPGRYRFGGVLDELAIYNSALSSSVTSQHYNMGFGAPYCFNCGDADGNGMVNISDVVLVINFVFGSGTPPAPLSAGDADCNGLVNISDAVFLVSYIFAGGASPCGNCR